MTHLLSSFRAVHSYFAGMRDWYLDSRLMHGDSRFLAAIAAVFRIV